MTCLKERATLLTVLCTTNWPKEHFTSRDSFSSWLHSDSQVPNPRFILPCTDILIIPSESNWKKSHITRRQGGEAKKKPKWTAVEFPQKSWRRKNGSRKRCADNWLEQEKRRSKPISSSGRDPFSSGSSSDLIREKRLPASTYFGIPTHTDTSLMVRRERTCSFFKSFLQL